MSSAVQVEHDSAAQWDCEFFYCPWEKGVLLITLGMAYGVEDLRKTVGKNK
jgi:hypothetical protein